MKPHPFGECVPDVLTPSLRHLWSITEQEHGNMAFSFILIMKQQKIVYDFSHGSILQKIRSNNKSNCKTDNFDILYVYSVHICYECIIDNTICLLVKLFELSLLQFLCFLRPYYRRTRQIYPLFCTPACKTINHLFAVSFAKRSELQNNEQCNK